MDVKEIRKHVDNGNAQWIEAFKRTDPALFASVFVEDGAILRRNGNVTIGREKILEGMRVSMQKMGSAEVTIKTKDMWVIDDLVYETGDYSYRFRPEGKEEVKTTGRYVTIWKQKTDGSWGIYRDLGLPNE